MYRNVLLPQLRRAPWRTALFLMLLATATAFFCLSGNLYLNSKRNIVLAEDAFSTVAYLEFYQAMAKDGVYTTVTASNYAGTFSVVTDDFDLNRLLMLPGSDTDRKDVTIYLSDDEGKSWNISRKLVDTMSAYSTLTVLPDGTIGCIVEVGKHVTPTDVGMRMIYYNFSLDWVLNK